MSVQSRFSNGKSRAGLYFGQLVVLLTMAFLAYLPGFRSPFQYDDVGLIEENKYIHVSELSPSNLLRAGLQDYKQNRPLTNSSFALNYYFGGLDPFGYHLVNFAILIFTAIGVWLLLQKLLLRLGYDPFKSGLAAWMTALAWAAHPINTQAVTYITQRHTSLSGAFCIWSLYFFHLALERGRGPRLYYAASGIFCIFAVLSKETALTFPVLLFIYKLYFFDGLKPGWLKRNWKWLAGLAVFYVAAFALALRPAMLERLSFYFGKMEFSAGQRFLTEFRVLVWYLWLVLFPLPRYLSIVHGFDVSTSIFHPATTLPAIILVLGVIFLALSRARQNRAASFLVIWYFGVLLIEALPLPIELAHEHRLYLASLSVIALLVCWPVLKVKNLSRAFLVLVPLVLLLAGFSWERNRAWRSGESLWGDAVTKAPYSKVAWYNYCTALPLDTKCDLVINACSKALEFYPEDFRVHNNIGYCYFAAGQLDQAEKYLVAASGIVSQKIAAEKQPSPSDKTSLSMIDYNLGGLYMQKKDYQKAADRFSASIQNNPVDPEARYHLAQAYRSLGNNEEQLRELGEALRLRPDWAKARLELAQALAQSGRCPEARELISRGPDPADGFKEVLDNCDKKKARPPVQE